MRQWLLGLTCLGLVLIGCDGGDGSGGTAKSNSVEASRPARVLGWLGGSGAPTDEPISVGPADSAELAGAILVGAVSAGPMQTAGVQQGDAIVAVGGKMLPIKDDATLDFIGALEQARSSGKTEVSLTLYRDGASRDVTLALPEQTLEEGLPLNVARFEAGAAAALAWLQDHPPTDARDLAYWELARLASGEENEGASPEATTPVGLSAAVLMQAERIGGLPDEILVRIAEQQESPAMAAGPGGMSGSFMVSDLSELPDGIREQVEKALSGAGGGGGGGVQMMVMDSSGGDAPAMDPEALREQFDLPEGAEISFSTSVIGGPDDLPVEMERMMAGGGASPGVDLSSILEELDPDRLPQLKSLQAQVDQLCDLQNEDGSWGAGDLQLWTSSQALAALGAAQRVGATLPADVVESGVTALRGAVSDGKLAAAVARGADRRVEWRKAAHAVRALRSLGCDSEDELLTSLERFLAGADVRAFTTGEDLLSHAVLARAGGVSAWQKFYDGARLQLVLAQQPDGSFSFGGAPARDTAIGALLLSLQHARTPVLIGTAENPAAVAIDGYGKPAVPAAASFELPSGGSGMPGGPGIMRRVRSSMSGDGQGAIEMQVEIREERPE